MWHISYPTWQPHKLWASLRCHQTLPSMIGDFTTPSDPSRASCCCDTGIRMAAKIIANTIVIGSGVLLRAVSQAYRKAIVNAGKTGVAQETMENLAHKVSKTMTEAEARLILGVDKQATWEEVLKRYDHLFERNGLSGSFYIQSKVQRAKECLEAAKIGGERARG